MGTMTISGVQAICPTYIRSRPPAGYKALDHGLGFRWPPRVLHGCGGKNNGLGGEVWSLCLVCGLQHALGALGLGRFH